MMHEWKGTGKVFSFTFTQQWKRKSFLIATVIILVLCFLLPAVIMPVVALVSDRKNDEVGQAQGMPLKVQEIYVVDVTSSSRVDLNVLNTLWTAGGLAPLSYRDFGDDTAAALAQTESDSGKSLILYLTEEDGACTAQVLLPEKTELTKKDRNAYTEFINAALPYLLALKMGVDAERVALLSASVEVAPHVGSVVPAPGEEIDEPIQEVSPVEKTREMLALILPYFNIMVLYFMTLFYGQSVANSVILEKTSKLVDTFLVSLQPGALVMGKLMAIASTAALQLLSWLAALLGGFGMGAMLSRLVAPDVQNGLLMLMDRTELWKGLFSLPTLLIAVLMLCGGFLLYCALAAIGGSMASKPEELSSTNAMFTMVLVISFMCTLYAGGGLMDGQMSSSASWLNWIPFTAIFVAPSRVMIGEMSVVSALFSLFVVLITALVLVMLAGKAYRMLILYKGKTLKPADLFRILRQRQ